MTYSTHSSRPHALNVPGRDVSAACGAGRSYQLRWTSADGTYRNACVFLVEQPLCRPVLHLCIRSLLGRPDDMGRWFLAELSTLASPAPPAPHSVTGRCIPGETLRSSKSVAKERIRGSSQRKGRTSQARETCALLKIPSREKVAEMANRLHFPY